MESGARKLIRGKISSNEDILNVLHEDYEWIPCSECIRPLPLVLENKLKTLEDIDLKWMSLKEYILHTVFGYPTNQICGRYYVPDIDLRPASFIFRVNDFPYAIKYGNHWVLWYPTQQKERSDEQVTADIEHALKEVVGGEAEFDFAWYENPKMSVPDFYHVQVFWTKL
jgi:hypothetical protein